MLLILSQWVGESETTHGQTYHTHRPPQIRDRTIIFDFQDGKIKLQSDGIEIGMNQDLLYMNDNLSFAPGL
jgi:hypothetical protein